ncbi:hypothetical protein LTR28_012630 [Elasticomyces elasticus]|nr:hypothetical protein LTR28_012630 [Elasticomyces elasticus]
MIISEEASARDERNDLRLGDRLSHDVFGSTTTEPGTPADDHHPSTLIGLGMELQEVHIPGAAVTGFPPDEVGTIIAADLGDMLDAIIIEHRGTLDSVITNLRDGAPGLEDIQRLSRELAEISRAVAEVPIERFTGASIDQSSHPVASGMKRRRSVIVDAPPAQIRKHVKSIPDLLQLIDSAADNLGLDVGQTNGSAASARGIQIKRHEPSHVTYREKYSSFASSGHTNCGRCNNARKRASSLISHTDRIAREYKWDAHFQSNVNESDTACSASSNRKGIRQAKPGRTAGESRSSCGEDEESRDKGIRDQAREGREMDEKGEGWIWG